MENLNKITAIALEKAVIIEVSYPRGSEIRPGYICFIHQFIREKGEESWQESYLPLRNIVKNDDNALGFLLETDHHIEQAVTNYVQTLFLGYSEAIIGPSFKNMDRNVSEKPFFPMGVFANYKQAVRYLMKDMAEIAPFDYYKAIGVKLHIKYSYISHGEEISGGVIPQSGLDVVNELTIACAYKDVDIFLSNTSKIKKLSDDGWFQIPVDKYYLIKNSEGEYLRSINGSKGKLHHGKLGGVFVSKAKYAQKFISEDEAINYANSLKILDEGFEINEIREICVLDRFAMKDENLLTTKLEMSTRNSIKEGGHPFPILKAIIAKSAEEA